MFAYIFLLSLLLSVSNVFLVWLLIELAFVFFLLFIINNESKNTSLVIYFLFQSFCSLILFLCIFNNFDSVVFIILLAKLGLFPFFYWLVIVTIKVRLLVNFFILGLQKLPTLWLLWLLIKSPYLIVYLIVYLNIFFVMLNLTRISDLWLLLVYSSISNTRLLIFRIEGAFYFVSIFIYLFIVMGMILFLLKSSSYEEIILVIFIFLTIPPFLLFFIKVNLVFRLDFSLKLAMFIIFFDVLILLYYFSLIFVKFLLLDGRFLVYLMNLLILLSLLAFRNYVVLVVFYES